MRKSAKSSVFLQWLLQKFGVLAVAAAGTRVFQMKGVTSENMELVGLL